MHAPAVAALLGLAACSPSPPGGLPCGPNGECPSGQSCDLASNICNGDSDFAIWKDDSAADFTADGAYLDEVTVEAGGFVAPTGFFTGGVLVSGISGDHVPDPDTAKFDMIIGQNPIIDRTVIRSLDIDYALTAPVGVGINAADGFTIVVEGEIQLAATGTWTFELDANDRGFFDVAPPGSDTFDRLIADGGGAPTTRDFEVTTPGWYRFRGMFADSSGTALYRLRVDEPGPSGGLRDVAIDEMRVRADDLEGIVIDGFEEPFCLDYRGTVRVDALDQSYGQDPFGIEIGLGAYTVRSSGQLLVDSEGDYAFRIDSLQGHRMWIDGQLIVDDLATTATVTVTDPVHLVAGWHDIVVDVNKAGGTGTPSLALTIESGPVTGPIASDHLRPVVGRDARFTEGRSDSDQLIPDGGSVTKTVTVTLPMGFVAERIDVDLEFAHAAPTTLTATLAAPGAGTITLANTGDITVDPGTVLRNIPATSLGTSYVFTATDTTIEATTGSVTLGVVGMIGRRGEAPFATSYRYESAVRELGEVVRFDTMTWTVRQGERTAVAMQIRTCDSPADCAAEPWTDVAADSVPDVPPRAFAQYGATITTNGDIPTALDAVELHYVLAR